MDQTPQPSNQKVNEETTGTTIVKEAPKKRKNRGKKNKPSAPNTPKKNDKKSRAGSTPEKIKRRSQTDKTSSESIAETKQSDPELHDALTSPEAVKMQTSMEADVEDNSDDETVDTDNKKPNAKFSSWATVVPKQKRHSTTNAAKDLAPAILRGYKTQLRGSFQLNITASTSREEAEDKATTAINSLIKILLDQGAELLPWKEADYAEFKVINSDNIATFKKLSYSDMRKLYVDSGYLANTSTKIYIYLYIGMPRSYNGFRKDVESNLTKAEIVWYKNSIQAERRYFLGYIAGSHQSADCAKIREAIHKASGVWVHARWRLWPTPRSARSNLPSAPEDKVFAIGLEIDARYTAKERLLVYRAFGSDPNERVTKAIDSHLTIHLVPGSIQSLSDKSQKIALAQRKFQGQVQNTLRRMVVPNTFLLNVNEPAFSTEFFAPADKEHQITMKNLIMTTINPKTNLPLLIAVDQPEGQDNPIFTYRESDRSEVDHFLQGIRITAETNANQYFGKEYNLQSMFTRDANDNYDGQTYDHQAGRYIACEENYFLHNAKNFVIEVDWTKILDADGQSLQAKMECLNIDNMTFSRFDPDASMEGTIHSNETRFQDDFLMEDELETQSAITQFSTAAGDHESEASAHEN